MSGWEKVVVLDEKLQSVRHVICVELLYFRTVKLECGDGNTTV